MTIEFTAKIEIRNGEIMITPDTTYCEFESFIWENKDKKLSDIINVLPF